MVKLSAVSFPDMISIVETLVEESKCHGSLVSGSSVRTSSCYAIVQSSGFSLAS